MKAGELSAAAPRKWGSEQTECAARAEPHAEEPRVKRGVSKHEGWSRTTRLLRMLRRVRHRGSALNRVRHSYSLVKQRRHRRVIRGG